MPSGVLGMLLFVIAEVMFFAGLMSAFTIVRNTALPGMWPPPGQPRLPADATAFNTVALLLSGVALFIAHRGFKKSARQALGPLLAALAFGATFLVLQGREWLALLAQGLTLTSSAEGAFFYLIVGFHAAHVVVALALLGIVGSRMRAGTLSPGFFYTVQTVWYFVVAMWPVIYARVYF